MSEQAKMLRLTIEVPDIYADDLDENASYLSEPDPPSDSDRLEAVLEFIDREVSLTVMMIPIGTDDQWGITSHICRVVGAEAVDRS